MKRIKSYLHNLGLSAAAVVLLLGCMELALRNFPLGNVKVSWSQPDSLLVWRYTPGAEYWSFQENDHPITGRINQYGWRDRDWSIAKPPQTVRIAVLGDSFVEAIQVEQEQTFWALAEAELNRRSPVRFELMNFGRSGFTTTEQLLVLEREVVRFSPDMVIVFFFPENDIEDVSRETCPAPMRPFYIPGANGELALDLSFQDLAGFQARQAINPIKQNSALVSFMAERANMIALGNWNNADSKGGDSSLAQAQTGIPGVLGLATANADARYRDAFELNKKLLAEIHRRCVQLQAGFLLVNINTCAYEPEVEEKLLAQDTTFNANFFDESLAEFARQNGLEFIGLQKIFRDEYLRTGKKSRWIHWNYEGHRLVARVLSDYLGKIHFAEKS